MKMPVYEFECTNEHITEELVPIGNRTHAVIKCKKKAKKILSTCSFELKGGGWYADGYHPQSPKALNHKIQP